MNTKWLIPCVAVTAIACATTKHAWTAAGTGDEPESRAFRVEVPAGWMRLGSEDSVLMTRDGPLLQRIAVARSELGKPLANTKKVLAAGMLPQEVAQLVADDLLASPAVGGANVVENVAALVGGAAGFRLTIGYRDRDGLRRRLVVYGAVVGPWLYRLTYVAPERHYFELDRAIFEDVARSFRPGAPPADSRRP